MIMKKRRLWRPWRMDYWMWSCINIRAKPLHYRGHVASIKLPSDKFMSILRNQLFGNSPLEGSSPCMKACLFCCWSKRLEVSASPWWMFASVWAPILILVGTKPPSGNHLTKLYHQCVPNTTTSALCQTVPQWVEHHQIVPLTSQHIWRQDDSSTPCPTPGKPLTRTCDQAIPGKTGCTPKRYRVLCPSTPDSHLTIFGSFSSLGKVWISVVGCLLDNV